MAKATTKTETQAAATTTAVNPKVNPGAVIEAPDFSGDAGAGMEGASQESFAIPFLSVLQKGSPQVDEASGNAIEGARQGMLFENVTGRLLDGKTGVTIVPCAYRRVFLRWAPREGGGGFKGELLPEEVANMRTSGKVVDLDGKLYFPMADGTVNPNRCDRLADVRNHYVLLMNDDGSWTQALLSLGSTQIKKSKMLMSALASVSLVGPRGRYTPATWANKVRLTTVGESNDKGSWMGVRFELAGQVTANDMYMAGKQFNESVRKGSVEAKYEEPHDPTTVDASGDGAEGAF